VVVVVLGLGFYPKLLALCFDEEFAELRGVRVKFYYCCVVSDRADGGAVGPRGGLRVVNSAIELPAAVAAISPAALADDAVAVLCAWCFVTQA